MTERQTGENPYGKPTSLDRVKAVGTSVALGGVFAIPSGLIAHFAGANDNLTKKIATGFGSVAIMVGVATSFSHLSMDEAEYYAEQGKTLKSRLKVLQATLEAGAGAGAAGGIIGYETGSLMRAAIGAGICIIGGTSSTLIEYSERTRAFPNLNYPSDNSVYLDTSFPNRKEGTKFPPVFIASSLKSWQDFRAINKERIFKWAHYDVPNKSDEPMTLNNQRLVTSVVIIPNVYHYPALDPELDEILLGKIKVKSIDMKLADQNESIVVHSTLNSFNFWPDQTIFEDSIGRHFNEGVWKHWKERSWNYGVVLLTQYQAPTMSNIRGTRKIEEVVDNYWLLDVLTGTGKR